MAQHEQDVPNAIYTVGHSNHPLETFLDLLRRHEIEVLIDTRSLPFSRYSPQFNRNTLKAAVQNAGIKYGFYGRELGGRPENPDFYDAVGHVDYAQVAGSELFQSGLARLVTGAAKYRTALLCSEENPSVCHRRLLIARVLFDRKIRVLHIRGDGSSETESILRESEARLAEEQEAWREEKQKEKQAAADLKAHAMEVRLAARRRLAEEAACRKSQRRQEAEAAGLEKRRRQEAAEQQAAERKRQAAERKSARIQAQSQRKASKSMPLQTVAVAKLFDMGDT